MQFAIPAKRSRSRSGLAKLNENLSHDMWQAAMQVYLRAHIIDICTCVCIFLLSCIVMYVSHMCLCANVLCATTWRGKHDQVDYRVAAVACPLSTSCICLPFI